MSEGFRWSLTELRLRHVFTIARGSRTIVPTVIVEYTRDGVTGVGEGSPLARYGESTGTVTDFLALVRGCSSRAHADPAAFLDEVDSLAPGNTAAKASVDIAIHDWTGKVGGDPVWRNFGLAPGTLPRSSYTIGIDEPSVVERKLLEAEPFEALKIKMGVPGERDFVRLVRSLTRKPLRIDANEGWKTREEALEHLEWLAGIGVELVEQPLPAGRLDDVAWLRERTEIPLFADEDLMRSADVPRLAGAYDGVNLKLMKAGGLREARRIAESARRNGMKVMIGCMVETSVGISAAAQLSPMADVLDLDGCLLVDNDPYLGAVGPDGTVRLTDLPGIGVTGRPR